MSTNRMCDISPLSTNRMCGISPLSTNRMCGISPLSTNRMCGISPPEYWSVQPCALLSSFLIIWSFSYIKLHCLALLRQHFKFNFLPNGKNCLIYLNEKSTILTNLLYKDYAHAILSLWHWKSIEWNLSYFSAMGIFINDIRAEKVLMFFIFKQ